ncbi:MAG: alpha/beta hydrolase, partial [Candidatus Hodarchaeales archaeon]
YTNVPLLSGHGTRPEDLQGIKYTDWINDVKRGYVELQEKCQGVFVVGQITGVVLALNLAINSPGILGLVSLSGIFKISRWQYFIRPVFNLLPEMIPFASKESRFIIHFKEDWKKVNAYSKVPKKSLLEMNQLFRQTYKGLKKIEQPLLVLHSTNTETIDKENADLIFRSVASKKKKLMFLDKGGALMTVGEGRDIVFKEVTDFLWSCIHLYQM